jgi:RHS repeat-associated protein
MSVPNQTPGAGWNFTYSPDGYGNVYSLSDPWGSFVYAPNALGEPTQVSGYASGVTYHPNGMVAGYTLANGITRRVSQNLRGLPDEWQDAGVIYDAYRYDANGNTTAILDWQWAETRTMGYDALDRLTTANGVWGTGQYGYDGLDNLRSSQVGGRSLTHHVDAQNRLSSLSGSQSVSFGYDANGNITQRGGQSYYFDIGNRLRHAVGKGFYDYDGHGRRGWVVWSNGSTQLNAYTGTGAAGRLMFSNHSTKGGTRYVYLGDKLIAEHNNQTGVSYSHTDALGSPVARTNGAGQIIGSRTRYEPYGATAAGDVPQGIGFTGHVNDPDTGLVYMQQRYYDSIAGRFLSVDPVVTDSSSGAHFGRYHYARNSPFTFVDPDGRAAQLVVPIVIVIAKEAAKSGAKGAVKDASKKAAKKGSTEGAKRGPKTDPDAPHNKKIREEADKLVDGDNEIIAGGGREPEKLVPTPGGTKPGRRPDTLYRTPKGEVRGQNVGRTKADGTPVKREVEAKQDLDRAGVPTDFVPYDR